MFFICSLGVNGAGIGFGAVDTPAEAARPTFRTAASFARLICRSDPCGSALVLELRMRMSAVPDPDSPLRVAGRRPGTRRPGKAEARAPTRNALIADFLAFCRLDPDVESLRAPASQASFDIAGGTVEHVADFEIVRDGTASLVDVTADADLERHPLRAAAAQGSIARDGRLFVIETARSLRAEPRATTVRLILACRRTPVTAGDRVRILHQLDECGAMRLVDCAGMVMNTRDGVAAVLALACEGLVAVDIGGMILPETQVRRRKVPYSDPFAF
jgi:hypothetical protein